MSLGVIGRDAELLKVAAFLEDLQRGPAALILQGEAGIGKTTLWQAGLTGAGQRGYQVIACRPVQSEARHSYASVADLLSSVDDEIANDLPEAQRQALEVALLRARPANTMLDHRAIATALLTMLGRMANRAPVVVAIDDLQWLDRQSATTIEFAVRRMTGRIGVLATLRTARASANPPPLRLADPHQAAEVEVGPLSLAALHHLLKERTSRTYPRPALIRIQAISGGNPFFALELVRFLGERPALAPSTKVPGTVTQLARVRLGRIDTRVREVLLASASLTAPTLQVLQRIDAGALHLVEQAEALDILEIDGSRIRFTHPILASGIYGMASPAQRRAMHRRLAAAGLDPEERARHLALASTAAEAETVAALDEAAAIARSRGAPAAAADLLDMAIRIGADSAERVINAASLHFESGDPTRARALLEETITKLPPGRVRGEAQRLLATVRLHDDSYQEASVLLEKALDDAKDDQALRIRVMLELSYVLTNLGRINDAVGHTTVVIDAAEQLGDRTMIAQALAASAIVGFLNGQGLDEPRLVRALALEDRNLPTAIMFRPSLIACLLWMWSGQLARAREGFYALRQDCLEKGAESDLMFVAFHTVMLECWRGDLASARAVADDAYERALQLGTEVPLAIALSTRANVAAFEGKVDECRETGQAALAIFLRGSCLVATLWPIAALGFLELSVEDFDAAAKRLGPMAAGAASMGVNEPVCIPFAADAAEALIAIGQTAQAAAIVDQLEHNGRRLDRAWALATGARCRALLLAEEGRMDEALESAARALAEHERLAMPLERARTLLVVGQLERRRGRRKAARASLEEAARVFAAAGASLWARKADAAMRRLGTQAGAADQLTPTEQRVGRLAATGMTNREVAAALFVSPKTVEANLSRIYSKLAIRSRAELGRRMAEMPQT